MVINRRAIFFTVIFFTAGAIFAQGVSLQSEIQNTESAVNRQGISAEQRHTALVRLASLRQLSGDIEGAAKNWLEAAAAIPGRVDDDALLACAYCLAAMGEWDRARAALEPLLSKSTRARFLDTSIRAIQSGDNSELAALAANPGYSQLKSEIYFMLWKISRGENAAETWRQRLLEEFSQTPEGRLAVDENSSSTIVQPSPFWLFLGRMDSFPSVEVVKPASQPASPVPAQTSPSQLPAETRLQTGVFGQLANAEAHMAGLRRAGFSPLMEQRGEMWVVIVPAGNDTNQSIAALRSAGFESFPLR
jgi:tetratricopeptide (TPR) repeat protein